MAVPRDLIYAAAADHCLGAAYRGECPGVDPDALMAWRVESRARQQRRSVDAILADIAAARRALRSAPTVDLLGQDADNFVRLTYGACEVADMRSTHVPELPEAGTRDGVAYIAQGLSRPGEAAKVVCSGTPEVIRAFMDRWAPAQGLTGIYGDPARGFAGGYVAEGRSC